MVAHQYNIPNFTGGVDNALVSVSGVDGFTGFFLAFIWLIIVIGGSLSQNRVKGYADIPTWATLGSIVVLISSLLMSLVEGMISLPTLGIVVAVTLASGTWLFLDKGKTEI